MIQLLQSWIYYNICILYLDRDYTLLLIACKLFQFDAGRGYRRSHCLKISCEESNILHWPPTIFIGVVWILFIFCEPGHITCWHSYRLLCKRERNTTRREQLHEQPKQKLFQLLLISDSFFSFFISIIQPYVSICDQK